MMETYCILCGAKVKDVDEYLQRKSFLIHETRYQEIIDVLIDSPLSYEWVFFQHDNDLPEVYREIALRRISALQKVRIKGLRDKFVDVTAVKEGVCNIAVQEELRPKAKKVRDDIKAITECKFLWVRDRGFSDLVDPCLFILINENVNNIPYVVRENVGTFKKVIICDKGDFEEMYEEHYLTS